MSSYLAVCIVDGFRPEEAREGLARQLYEHNYLADWDTLTWEGPRYFRQVVNHKGEQESVVFSEAYCFKVYGIPMFN